MKPLVRICTCGSMMRLAMEKLDSYDQRSPDFYWRCPSDRCGQRAKLRASDRFQIRSEAATAAPDYQPRRRDRSPLERIQR